MKLIYCSHSICNPGGIEHVLLKIIYYDMVSMLKS